MSLKRTHILCFGEVLWDCVPRGLFLGGGPANVAYHLTRLGFQAALVSAVGKDFLGEEILRRLTGWGVDTSFIAKVAGKQTGVVLVDLADATHPSYDIVRDVAWDEITGSAELDVATQSADALVYGTLALRQKHNRRLIDHLLSETSGLKVLDVNLRPPFVDRELTLHLGRRSGLIKLNEGELGVLLQDQAGNDLETRAAKLARETSCGMICITCGAKGAGFLIDGAWHWVDAEPIVVKDTIGAGDAFLAALIAGLVAKSHGPDRILARAARLAEFVAASDGATPDYSARGRSFLPGRSS